MKPLRSKAMVAATRPSFPFFDHRTLEEVDETERLENLLTYGVIKPYEMLRLKELRQKAAAARGAP